MFQLTDRIQIGNFSLQYFLPLDLITKEMFTQWMEVCRQIVDRAVPEVSLTEMRMLYSILEFVFTYD